MPKYLEELKALIKNNKKVSIAFFSVFIIVTIIVLVTFISLLSSKTTDTPPLITDDDIKLITKGVTFSDTGSASFEYQSPIHNFSFEIDTINYNLSESTNGISLLHKNYNIRENIRIEARQPISTTSSYNLEREVKFYESYINTFAESDLQVTDSTSLDSIDAHIFIYTRKSASVVPFQTVAIMAVNEDKLYVLEYSIQQEEKLDKDTVLNIFKSFRFIDSSNLNFETRFESNVYGYGFDYDSREWRIDGSYKNSVYLFNRNTNWNDEKIQITFDSQEISRFDLVEKENSYLYEYTENRINTLKTSLSSKGLEIVNQETILIDGRRAIMLEYTLDTELSYGSTKFTREYIVVHYNAVTRISLAFDSTDSEAFASAINLIESFKIFEPSSGQVKGITNQNNSIEKIVVQSKPSVVRIFAKNCASFEIKKIDILPLSSGNKHQMCSLGTGTGFYITGDGYVATNGHVVVSGELETILNGFMSGSDINLLLNLFKDIVQPQLAKSNPKFTNMSDRDIVEFLLDNPTVIQELAVVLVEIVFKQNSPIKLDSELHVQRSGAQFSFDQNGLTNKSIHFPAELVDYDYEPLGDLTEDEYSDVAILKVDGKESFPSLSLGSVSDINEGSTLILMGFPGLATDLDFVSDSSKGEETVTRGIVSSFKKTNSDKLLIQTDASLQKGNSGGPGIDSQGRVIGLATYLLHDTGSANYGFLRDVEDLKQLMQKHNIVNNIGEAEQEWRIGIDHFFAGRFSMSIESFNKVKRLNPDFVEADPLINIAETKIKQGLDNTDGSGSNSIFSKFTNTEIILGGAVIVLFCLVMILVIVTFFIMIKLMRKPKNIVAQVSPQINPGNPVNSFYRQPVSNPTATSYSTPQTINQSTSSVQQPYPGSTTYGSNTYNRPPSLGDA
jgi:S1-C subfamily serine protease